VLEKATRTGQRADPFHQAQVRGGVVCPQLLEQRRRDLAVDLPQQHFAKESTAHSDTAMDTPHGQLDAGCVESLLPGGHVLVNAVEESTVQIERKLTLPCGMVVLRLRLVTPRRRVAASMSQSQRA
jgi:hypothetical protein